MKVKLVLISIYKPTATIFCREIEGSMFHLDVSTPLPDDTVSHPKEPQDAYSGPRNPPPSLGLQILFE